jgi:putative SOS response-associated peptidase YedK
MYTFREKHPRQKEPPYHMRQIRRFSNLEKLQDYFPIDNFLDKVTLNYNVAPTQEIFVIIRQRRLERAWKTALGLAPVCMNIGKRLTTWVYVAGSNLKNHFKSLPDSTWC